MEFGKIIKEFIVKYPEDINQVLPFLSRTFHENEINPSITFAQFALTEFTLNAFKAIQKRVFFKEKNLDIEKDYHSSIAEFKNSIKYDEVDIKTLLKNNPEFVVKIFFDKQDNEIGVHVESNTGMMDDEIASVNNSIESSEERNHLEDPAYQNSENAESAGIGLKMVVMMAKNMGLSSKILSYSSDRQKTIFSLRFPTGIKEHDNTLSEISFLIAEKLKSVPILEDSLELLIDSDYSKNPLLKDPGFLINFLLSRKNQHTSTESIFSPNASQEFFDHHSEFSAISENSELGKIYKEMIELSAIILILENFLKLENGKLCRIAALLCRLGKIITSSLDDELADKIREMTNRRKPVSAEIPNEVSIGINDSILGISMAKVWNFPKEIVNSIQFHEKPWMLEEEDPITNIVHLAIAINQMRKKQPVENFDPATLKKLQIEEADLKNFYLRFLESIDKKGND